MKMLPKDLWPRATVDMRMNRGWRRDFTRAWQQEAPPMWSVRLLLTKGSLAEDDEHQVQRGSIRKTYLTSNITLTGSANTARSTNNKQCFTRCAHLRNIGGATRRRPGAL